MFEVQWELSCLKRSKMTSQLCTLYVRLCTLYVRVEFPGIHSLGMLLMQDFQFNIIMLLAGLLGFLCDSQTHPLCVRESNGSVVLGQIQHFVLSSWKRWVKIPPLVMLQFIVLWKICYRLLDYIMACYVIKNWWRDVIESVYIYSTLEVNSAFQWELLQPFVISFSTNLKDLYTHRVLRSLHL